MEFVKHFVPKPGRHDLVGIKPISDNAYRVIFTNWYGGHVDGRHCEIGEIYTVDDLDAIEKCNVFFLTLWNGEKE